MGFIGNIKKKIIALYKEDDLTDQEFERYLENYNETDEYGVPVKDDFWKEWSLKSDEQDPDEEYLEWKKNHETVENVNLSHFSEPDMIEYIRDQCEIMEDATHHIDEVMLEYNNITEHFSDIELFENAPDILKVQIGEAAERVDNLLIDRRIVKSGEAKLSNSAYHRMEAYEEEIPEKIAFIEDQENYYDDVARDIRILEGELYSMRMEARALKRRQMNIRQSCIIMLACFFVIYCVFIISAISTADQKNITVCFVITFIGAILAVGSYALMYKTRRDVAVTEIRINKLISILNKTKIKFVNVTNVLDYEYMKYRIKNANELERKYECFIEMKQEQQQILRMTAHLDEAEKELLSRLEKLGMNDATVWLTQAKGLYNHNELVEIRHDLAVGRQKIREQIEYNEKRIQTAKDNIKHVMDKYPQYMKATMEILDEFEQHGKRRTAPQSDEQQAQ